MRKKTFGVLGFLLAAALALGACARGPSAIWPGLSTDGSLAYLAEAQFVHKIDAATGSQEWKFPAAANPNTGVFVSDPGVGGDVIVVGSEGATNSYSGILYGLDPATGQQKWCLAFDQKGASKQNCPIARGPATGGLFGLSDGVVYFGLASGTVYAVDASKGTDLWFSTEPKRDVWAAPAVAAQTVYVTSLDHHLYALDRSTGALQWQQDLGAAVAGTPTLSDGKVYVGTFGNSLYALDAATGNVLWHKQADNWVWSGPAMVDGTLYFVDVGGAVYACQAETGDKLCQQEGQDLWKVKPGGPMRATPAVTADTVYVGDRAGTLFALNRADGATRWSKTLKGQLLVTPLVVGDLVIVAPYGGTNLLEAYTTGGEFKWAYAPG